MMTTTQLDSIRDSYRAIQPHLDELSDRFFTRLFTAQPALKSILPRDHWQRTADLHAALGLIVKHLTRPQAIQHALLELGARAARAGVSPHHYGLARKALIDSMKDVVGPDWTTDTEQHWTDVLNAIVSIAVLGAGRARAKAA